jgi:RimJ/RimL family protein N-acetyltransferase
MQLETERLVLREFVEDDVAAVLAYQQTPEYGRLRGRDSYTLDEARAFVGMFIAWQSEAPRRRYQLAIVLKWSLALVGTCGIRVENPDDGEATIGYELDPAYWGRGFATEAATQMLSFAFGHLGLRRVIAWCHVDNADSIRVLEKLGMRGEGQSEDTGSAPEHGRDHYRFVIAAR